MDHIWNQWDCYTTEEPAENEAMQRKLTAPLAIRTKPLKDFTSTKCLIQSGRGAYEGKLLPRASYVLIMN